MPSPALPLRPLALLPLGLLVTALNAQAQTAAVVPAPAPAATQPALPPSAENQLTERLSHEDAGSRIDELRVGGQTRSIQVQPKNGSPSYEIAPSRGGEDLSESSKTGTTAGRSRWRLVNF